MTEDLSPDLPSAAQARASRSPSSCAGLDVSATHARVSFGLRPVSLCPGVRLGVDLVLVVFVYVGLLGPPAARLKGEDPGEDDAAYEVGRCELESRLAQVPGEEQGCGRGRDEG